MKIGLFIPCYVDALYPEVGVSTLRLLRSLGLDVDYPEKQTCCGQPMGNAGFERMAVPLARKFDELFKGYDYVVAPSASCAAYVRLFHPRLLSNEAVGTHKPHECEAAGKTMDLVEFLHDVVKVESLPAKFPHKVSVHNSCHGVRELGLSSPSERNIPRFNKMIDLLKLVEGIEIVEPERPDECCGFGGMFAVEEQAVSARMGLEKVRRHMATGAEYITGPDSSCLMHMQGVAQKQGLDIKFIHVAQILSAGL
ncbi:MAG: (Fe-S)-binding protein [Prevotella sp.]|nr:(Fe-S)-binding protein [Prevotella sp.]